MITVWSIDDFVGYTTLYLSAVSRHFVPFSYEGNNRVLTDPKNIQKDSKRKGGTSWFSAAGQSDSAIDAANLALGQERERE